MTAGDRFTMHRERHFGVIVALLAFLLVVETAGMHVGLAHWSPLAAWISTALSAQALVWILGDFRALRRDPIVLADDALVVAQGWRWRLAVPWRDVAAVTPLEARPAKAEDLLDAGVLGPNVLVALAAPTTARGPLGLTRRVTRVALTVDRREAFLAAAAQRTVQATGGSR